MSLGENIARLAVSLSLDTREFAMGATKAQRDMGRLRDSFNALGERWMQTGKRLSIGVTAPLTAFGLASAKTASDAQELDSAFTETFDNLAGSMRTWAQETGDAMGRSTQSIQEMANTFGIFFNQAAPTRKEAAEMSKTFTVLAQDLSSFYNVSGDEALQKLRSGLSGESEPLRDFGVFLTEATVKAKAMEMGLAGVGDELTEQEKILARYQLILESTQDAQGDVARTSGGAANQWRSFTEALQELQVVIGERLLPLLTPLVKGLTNIVNGFNNLPSGVQTAIVAVGAMMAAIGPMMLVMGTLAATILPLFAAKFGPIGIAISAFINPLGTAISFLASFAAKLAGMTVLKTVAGFLLRMAGPLGLIASAGILIYKNWDRISEVFAKFWARVKEAIGPPLQQLIATITDAFNTLWNGPLGDGISAVMGVLSGFGSLVLSVLGEALIRTLKIALEFVVYAFEQIGTAIEVVNALLNGDFRGAWDAAKGFVTNAVTAVLNIIETLAPGAVEAMKRLYTGVKTWLQNKLGAVFGWVNDKIEGVKNAFKKMYIAVVGNSYVPDMVVEIGQHMRKLLALMVDPARSAAQSTEDAFRQMASNVSSILDRLFPKVAALRDLRSDIAAIDEAEAAGILSSDVAAEARRRLGREYRGDDGYEMPDSMRVGPIGNAVPVEIKTIETGLDRLLRKGRELGETIRNVAADAFAELGYQLKGVLVGAQNLGDALKNILASLADMAFNMAWRSLGQGLSLPGFAAGTMSAPRGLAWVGERGPELVNFRGGERVYNNRDSMAMAGAGGTSVVVNQKVVTPDANSFRRSERQVARGLSRRLGR